MAMTNAERQRKWLSKNRALHNFRRRKKNLGGGVGVANQAGTAGISPTQPFQVKKVGELNMVVIPKSTESAATGNKPVIFRDDYGRVITEAQWDRLQKIKTEAKNGGYEIDEFTQI